MNSYTDKVSHVFSGNRKTATKNRQRPPRDAANVAIDNANYHFSEDTGSALKRYRADEPDYIDVFSLDQNDWVRKNLYWRIKP